MEHKVKGCKDCVFLSKDDFNGGSFCEHPTFTIPEPSPYINLDSYYMPITPDFCPLKKEPITISIEQP